MEWLGFKTPTLAVSMRAIGSGAASSEIAGKGIRQRLSPLLGYPASFLSGLNVLARSARPSIKSATLRLGGLVVELRSNPTAESSFGC